MTKNDIISNIHTLKSMIVQGLFWKMEQTYICGLNKKD